MDILFEDEDFVAINKPGGLLVHKTKISSDTISAQQILRDQLGMRVHPVHRIDRPTSGVLLFAKKTEVIPFVQNQFIDKSVQKSYLAIIRGWPQEKSGTIDSPLKMDDGSIKEAITDYEVLSEFEWPEQVDKFATSRYSLIRATPQTGRTHQIRRHMRRIGGPIIGDVQHGKKVHNLFFEERFDAHGMLLLAEKLSFKKSDGTEVHIEAPLPENFLQVFKAFEYKY
ncbi:MAG: pseudouridylate synthase [Lentisphaeraceae bacterium]|nr:pseudouridylate synthase [Lentisphaeraceae bacterium]